MKGFSILTIVVMHLIQSYMRHTPNLLKLAVSAGGTGVHVFIFCSGFGLYLSHLNNKKNLKDFLAGRLWKIYLPYIIVVLVSALIPFMYLGTDKLSALFSHVFLYKMFIPEYTESFGTQLWFISTILQLYLLFLPLSFYKKRVEQKKFLAFCLALSITWWITVILLGKSGVRIYNSFCLQYLWEFALGMCVAEHLYKGHDICLRRWTLLLAAVAGMGITLLLAIADRSLRVINDIPAFAGYSALALLLYSIVCGNTGRNDLETDCKGGIERPGIQLIREWVRRIMLFFSAISYEWYLVHIMVFSIVFHIILSSSFKVDCIVGIAAFMASVFAAWGYSILLRWVRRWMK